MKEDGTFEELKLKGIIYSGKRLLDYLEDVVKMAYFLPDDDPTKDWYRDFMWYLCHLHHVLEIVKQTFSGVDDPLELQFLEGSILFHRDAAVI